MSKQIIAPANVHPARGYSHAIKAGNTIYVSGQVGKDKQGKVVGGGFEAQADQAFANLTLVLRDAGAAATDIVKLNLYFRNMADMTRLRDPWRKYLGKHFPATTAVQIVSLAEPELLLEVEAVAVVEKE